MGGNTGRAPKSVEAMRRAGTANESRLRKQGRTQGPTLERGIPAPPPGFDPAARNAYDYYADELAARGVLALSDGPALAELATVRTDLIAARHRLSERGSSPHYQTPNGAWRTYPEMGEVDRLQRRFMSLLRRFGLTPDSREAVHAIPESIGDAKDDPWDKLNDRKDEVDGEPT